MKRHARLILGLATAGAVIVGPAVAASAADNYGAMPGANVSQEHTQCAGHGSFGAFGSEYNFAGGANGTQTAVNNSNLCGNPQGVTAAP